MPPKTHADLGASKADRWMHCPGSVSAESGLPDVSSPYALEGTAAHALAERALTKDLDPDVWLETEIGGVLVTEEMVEAVRVFVDHVRSLVQYDDDELFIEQGFDLDELNPPGPMHGTADVVIWSPRRRTMYVCDYKHGKGVTVDAFENVQLGYYGLGAVLKLRRRPDQVVTTIVQPRAYHPDGKVRSHEWSWADLVVFKRELFTRAEATTLPDAPRAVGDWCKFCRAAAVCPAQRAHATDLVRTRFDVEETFVPPAPEALTGEQIALVLERADLVRGWLASVEGYVRDALERGESFPGWKLVPKRANRKWAEGVTAGSLAQTFDFNEEELYTRKVMSPAQVEKLIKASYPAGTRPEIPPELVVQESTGNNLAPDHDPRPAVEPAAVTFEIEDAPSESSKSSASSKSRKPRSSK
jgi:hypothetical protein